MLFRREKPLKWTDKLRIAVWPRRSWARSGSYVAKRILRLTASPHAVAAGVAAGVFASFSPFIGLHFVMAVALAYIIAGDMIAAALATLVGNPLTLPAIWASTYSIGRYVLHEPLALRSDEAVEKLAGTSMFSSSDMSVLFNKIIALWDPVFKPMAIGSLPLGLGFGLVSYFLVRLLLARFRQSRHKRIAAKLAARMQSPAKTEAGHPGHIPANSGEWQDNWQ